MGFGRRWPDSEPRPKVERLSQESKERILKTLEKGIASSPVLSALNIRVRALRGRFYFERLRPEEDGSDEIEIMGRVTPIKEPKSTLLLEAEKKKGSYFEIARGGAEKLVDRIAGDTRGTFHGLGQLDKSLRGLEKGVERREIEMLDEYRFRYADSGEDCSVQEVLFHFFGVPIEVVAEPSLWYWYRREPKIVEVAEDRTKILVNFTATGVYGSDFSGTCLYAKKNDRWGAFTIKPNRSGDIATAVRWLEKKGWEDW